MANLSCFFGVESTELSPAKETERGEAGRADSFSPSLLGMALREADGLSFSKSLATENEIMKLNSENFALFEPCHA